MSSTIEPSYLTDIANAEQLEMEATETLAAALEDRIEEVRKQAQVELSTIPEKVREERRSSAQEAKEKADRKVSNLIQNTASREQEIDKAAAALEDRVFELILAKICPTDHGVVQ